MQKPGANFAQPDYDTGCEEDKNVAELNDQTEIVPSRRDTNLSNAQELVQHVSNLSIKQEQTVTPHQVIKKSKSEQIVILKKEDKTESESQPVIGNHSNEVTDMTRSQVQIDASGIVTEAQNYDKQVTIQMGHDESEEAQKADDCLPETVHLITSQLTEEPATFAKPHRQHSEVIRKESTI